MSTVTLITQAPAPTTVVTGTNDSVVINTTDAVVSIGIVEDTPIELTPEVGSPANLLVQPEIVHLITTAAEQGPRGLSGHGATPFVASTSLSGHQFVYVNTDGLLAVASADNLATASTVLGMTTGAVVSGATTIPQDTGVIEFNGWNFTPGPVILGLNGQPVQTPAVGALFTLSVGTALSATKVLLSIRTPIINS